MKTAEAPAASVSICLRVKPSGWLIKRFSPVAGVRPVAPTTRMLAGSAPRQVVRLTTGPSSIEPRACAPLYRQPTLQTPSRQCRPLTLAECLAPWCYSLSSLAASVPGAVRGAVRVSAGADLLPATARRDSCRYAAHACRSPTRRCWCRPSARWPNALIYFGGNAEDVSRNLPGISKPSRTTRCTLHYRGYGGSSGSPSEEAIARDAMTLFDQVVLARPPQITVVGRSLGSGVAVRLASARPRDWC